MKIFITGGAGYIGSTTAEAMLQAGHSVTVYNSLVTGHRAAVPEHARFIKADLGDLASLEAALASEAFSHFPDSARVNREHVFMERIVSDWIRKTPEKARVV